MKFKKFAKLEDVPEAQRDEALELKDGTFVLFDASAGTEGFTAEDKENLNKAVRAARKERDEALDKVKTVQSALDDATKKLEVLEVSGKQSDEKITAMLTKWEADKKAAVDAAVAAVTAELTPLRAKVEKYELDDKLSNAFTKAGGIAAKAAKALVLAKQEGWQLVDGMAVRKDADGQVMTMTPDEYFTTSFAKDLPEWFTGSLGDGGGSPPKGGQRMPGSGGGETNPTKWSSEERRSFIEARGIGEYTKLLDATLVPSAPK